MSLLQFELDVEKVFLWSCMEIFSREGILFMVSYMSLLRKDIPEKGSYANGFSNYI